MSYDVDDTICAIGTARGGAARGMVRVSGPNATEVVSRLLGIGTATLVGNGLPAVYVGTVRVMLHDKADHHVPCSVFTWPTERSYTRQPVVELHTLGSQPLLTALLKTTCEAGARLAEPGEFTLRAFLAGRIDLTQAEAVLGVIDATESAELDIALAQLAGGLAAPLHQLRESLLMLLAELEAGLDFVDEDIEFVSPDVVMTRLADAEASLEAVSQQMSARNVTASLARVVLTGPPNAGKSSLFNAIVERWGVRERRLHSANVATSPARALVSDERGTTRDYLTAVVDLDGVQCELVDTAGIELQPAAPNSRSDNPIDAIAQGVAVDQREQAAVRLVCCDQAEASSWRIHGAPRGSNDEIIVMTKADRTSESSVGGPAEAVVTSAVTGQGIDDLCRVIRERLSTERASRTSQVVAATGERCRESVDRARDALAHARAMAGSRGGDELVAGDLRIALSELGKVVGVVYTDDLLDRIFSKFCIGK